MKEQNSPDPFPDLRQWAENRLKQEKREAVSPELQGDNQRLIQELQIHQIELEMQNAELRRNRAEVEALLAQYADLYDFAPAGYFTLNIDGVIRRVNLTGSQLLGEERARLVNRQFAQFILMSDRSKFNYFLQNVFMNRTAISDKVACEVNLDKKQESPPLFQSSGERQACEASRCYVHIEATATEDGQECRAVMMDITQRKQAEAAIQESHAKLERNLKGSIDIISEMIEKKGACVLGHHRRVAALASAIAREVKLTEFQMQGIGFAAAVYDIGLIDIPSEFIQDTNRLEGLKLTMYQGYPQAGYDALMKIESPWPISEIILQHRECFDGSGFPRGLKGEAILIEARVLSLVDAIEDLISNKINRQALPMEEALAVIGNHGGTRYDPDVVMACLRLFKEKGYKMEN